MDSYIRASGFVLYPYVFVAGPNKHDNLLVFSLARKLQQNSVATVVEIQQNQGGTVHRCLGNERMRVWSRSCDGPEIEALGAVNGDKIRDREAQ